MSISIIEDFHIRAVTFDDIAAIVDLMNAAAISITGEPTTTEELYRAFLARPNLNIATDTWLVHTDEGKLVGHAVFVDRAPHVSPWAWIVVHPDYHHQGVGSMLIHLTEERARDIIPLAPPNARVAFYHCINNKNDHMAHLLIQHGYPCVRHSWRMRIDLDEQPPTPVFPAHIRLRAIDPERDGLTVYRTVDETFRDHWGHVDQPEEEGFARIKHYMDTSPNFDASLWFLAVNDTSDGEEIAGVILCDPRMANDPDMAYISAVGVKRAWRQQGVGLAMLHHVFGELYRRTIQRAALHVDAESLTGATRLYEKAGMHIDQEDGDYEKVLRPGYDLMTQTIED